MISVFLFSHAPTFFVVGLLLGLLSGVWLLFASYSCDAHLARWSYFLPLLTIRLVVTYPQRCLAPFLLQHVAFLFCLPLLLRVFRIVTSIGAAESL